MPFEPLRFLHAANLCLDATLQCTIALPTDAQAEVEDATQEAFSNLIDACISRRVDFLLLTGNCFIERDRSLRARLALRDGFRELEQHGIPVFVTPGEHDPSEAWHAIPELPDNVTVCHPANPEPVAVMRDGKVIATIANNLFYGEADHFGIKSSPTTGDRRPYRIGMLHPSRLAEMEGANGPLDFEEDNDYEFEPEPEYRQPESDTSVSDTGSANEREYEREYEREHEREYELGATSLLSDKDRFTAVERTNQTQSELDRLTEPKTSLSGYPDFENSDLPEPSEVEQTLAAFLRQALVDYAVLTGRVSRRTIRLRSGLAHSPGRTQPLASADHGKHGATLVEVNATGQARCRREPTVTTRWKSIDVDLGYETSPEQIQHHCQELLAAEPREPTESIWLINWNLTAQPSVLQDFRSVGYTEQFANALDDARAEGDPSYIHSFRVFPSSQPDETLGEELLVSQFNRLAANIDIDEELLQQLIPGGTRELAWNDRLRALTSELDADLVAAHLRRFGGHWFAKVGVAEDVGVAAPDAFETDQQPSEGLGE